jgi:hypothetical protein
MIQLPVNDGCAGRNALSTENRFCCIYSIGMFESIQGVFLDLKMFENDIDR